MRLLLGSGGFSTEERRSRWKTALNDFLGDIKSFVFIPYALADYDDDCEKIRKYDFNGDAQFSGIHSHSDPIKAIESAEAIFVGGGNSFRLLNTILEKKLLEPIQGAVRNGIPYIGMSAGTNLSCPTIKTTNDMPIIHPPQLEALDLISFQINPHYFSGKTHILKTDGSTIPYGGETRDDRIREFHEMNDLPVLGLWEGEILKVESNKDPKLSLHGDQGVRLFLKDQKPIDLDQNSLSQYFQYLL